MNKYKLVSLLIIGIIFIILTDCGTRNLKIPHKVNENKSTAVFRVQIGIVDTQAEADNLAKSVRTKTDYPVYVEYIVPFYRVQVGDFVRKSDAEKCVEFLKKKGYSDSRYIFKIDNSQ
jgi:hypothetical protein